MTTSDVRRTVLGNGLRVVTEAVPGALSVTLGVWVQVGSRDEPAELTGESHFLEHLLFKGTPERSALDLAVAVDAVGGEMNAYTAKEHTAFYIRVPATHRALGIDILTDVVASPGFGPDDVDAERQVILEELLMEEDTPDDLVHSALFESMFPGHPLGWEVLGTTASIEAMRIEHITSFFEEFYNPSNLIVAAAGDVDHDEVLATVEARFGDRTGGRTPLRTAPGDDVRRLTVQRRPTEQAHLALAWRGLDLHDPDRHAMGVANQVLGGGLSSRLFQEIRERRGLAYSVFSGVTPYSDSGVVSIYAGTAPSRADEVRGLIDEVVTDLSENGITEAELKTAKGFLEGSLLLSLEDSGSRMSRLAMSEAIRGEVVPLDVYVDRLRAVELDDVHRVLKRVFASAHSVSAVGPFDEDAFA